MKILTLFAFCLLTFGCSANNGGDFQCSTNHKEAIAGLEELVASTKRKVIYVEPSPEVEFYMHKDSYGGVLLTFDVNDKGWSENLVIVSECPRRVFTKLSKEILKKYKFQKARVGTSYSAAVIITFE
ncbi:MULTISPECIES: hypothetical protein [unclassified Pseudoalteromonas]|uniref:hypothetical protein n=1 Tax=unclassified Pseudoalteromonas TaxID=194690 RepID=UPI002097A0CC|nr:hypothetical protein [Pseudoalteromonas sp. XMcav2-N]MCO7191311.1 hypothetical protein [Pseudoalteromonas sp. XMcav2-N]